MNPSTGQSVISFLYAEFITYSRNAVHSQIHKVNHGFSESTLINCEHFVADLAKNSRVSKHLQQFEKVRQAEKSEAYRKRVKRRRCASRLRRYKVNSQVHYHLFD